jgi:hypothetical protein
VARILIVGGGCRALGLARELAVEGHAVRMVAREEPRRAEIEQAGAECWIGTPDRLSTLRAALESVTVACWLLATATGGPDEVRDLHGSRLEFFLGQSIDTTVRGFVYETGGVVVPPEVLAAGAATVRRVTSRNAIPLALVAADPRDTQAWLSQAREAVRSLLG